MKKIAQILMLGTAAVLFAACSSTVITEYDDAGNVVKTTETDQSAFAIAMQSIDKKDNFMHGSFWAVGVNPATSTYGIGAGDFVIGSINDENGAVNASGYTAMINASKVSLDITATADGITAKAEGGSDANASSTVPETENK